MQIITLWQVVQRAVQSCVRQCKGSPQLLCLVDAYIRRTVPVPHKDRHTIHTLHSDFTQQWRDCADNLFSAVSIAQGSGALATKNDILVQHVYLRLVRRALESADHAAQQRPQHDGVSVPDALRAVLRLIAYAKAFKSREWHPWREVRSEAAMRELAGDVEEGREEVEGRAYGTVFSKRIRRDVVMVMDEALQELVDHAILEVHFTRAETGVRPTCM